MMKYIEDRGSPFSKDYPTTLQNIVTKEVMSEEIRKDLLHATEQGKLKYEAFREERLVSKRVKLNEVIHRTNIMTMASVNDTKPQTIKSVIREKKYH